ncbi:MAG: Ig-like domain-containing protein, partial [Gemmatimonadota bacterium]
MQNAECRTNLKGGPLSVRRLFALAVAVLGVTTWLSCSDALEPVPGPAIEVQVTPGGTSISGVGATAAFGAVAVNANGDTITSPDITWSSLNPHVATIDEDGIATAVASGQVTIAAEVDGQLGYSLLTVSTPGVGPITSWNVELPPIFPIQDIWGNSATDIYAVRCEDGVLHYDGISWNEMTGAPDECFFGVWGSSSSDVFAVGFDGAIAHYDGTGWSTMTSGTTVTLQGVWGTSSSDVFAVGWEGTILHYDGNAWST